MSKSDVDWAEIEKKQMQKMKEFQDADWILSDDKEFGAKIYRMPILLQLKDSGDSDKAVNPTKFALHRKDRVMQELKKSKLPPPPMYRDLTWEILESIFPQDVSKSPAVSGQ